MAICWLLVDDDGETKAKLFVGSAYDGSRGGNSGVAHQLHRIARELSKPGGYDAAHSEHGVQITIDKTIPHEEKYPTCQMTRHEVAVPIQRYLDRMSDAEVNAICPLHEVIRTVDKDQEWELLAKVIGMELRDTIRDATDNTSKVFETCDDSSDEWLA